MKNALLIIAGIFGLCILSVLGYALGWFGEAASVAQKEFGARAALGKYEWFKNQAAAIRAAEQARNQFQSQLTKLEESQLNTRDIVSIQLMESKVVQARSDPAAFESNLKNLKEEYNAASSKMNWSLFKDSDVPTRY